MKVLRFKHLFGEEPKVKFEQVKPTTITCDSHMVKSNEKYTAFIWSAGGGGQVCIVESDKPTKLPIDYPMLKGHQGQILDLDWSPFDNQFLATASQDSTLKIWQIPETITEDITKEVTTLQGHDKKVNLVQWHPTASWVLASASHDQTVKIWDVQKGVAQFTTNINALPYSLEWNVDGTLIGLSGNDKKLKIIDPRTEKIVHEMNAHQGTKPQKFGWLGSTGFFISAGFNKNYQREYSFWNIEKVDAPISTNIIDSGSGIISPFYDDQLGVLYLAGKGDSSIRYFEFQDGQLHFLTQYAGGNPGKGTSFFPKKAVDVNKCEVMRAAKLEENALSFVSFIAPRKSQQFQEDLYPECPGNEAALTAEQYFAGQTSQPKLISQRPEQQDQQQKAHQDVVFTQQTAQQKPQSQPQTQKQTQSQNQQQQSVEELLKIIEQQKQELLLKDNQIQQLQEELANFEQQQQQQQ